MRSDSHFPGVFISLTVIVSLASCCAEADLHQRNSVTDRNSQIENKARVPSRRCLAALLAATALRDLTKNVPDRSACRWTYRTDHSLVRIPSEYPVAVCETSPTLHPTGIEVRCEPVYYYVAARYKRRTGDEGRPYVWVDGWEKLAVGCATIMVNVTTPATTTVPKVRNTQNNAASTNAATTITKSTAITNTTATNTTTSTTTAASANYSTTPARSSTTGSTAASTITIATSATKNSPDKKRVTASIHSAEMGMKEQGTAASTKATTNITKSTTTANTAAYTTTTTTTANTTTTTPTAVSTKTTARPKKRKNNPASKKMVTAPPQGARRGTKQKVTVAYTTNITKSATTANTNYTTATPITGKYSPGKTRLVTLTLNIKRGAKKNGSATFTKAITTVTKYATTANTTASTVTLTLSITRGAKQNDTATAITTVTKPATTSSTITTTKSTIKKHKPGTTIVTTPTHNTRRGKKRKVKEMEKKSGEGRKRKVGKAGSKNRKKKVEATSTESGKPQKKTRRPDDSGSTPSPLLRVSQAIANY